MQALDWRFNRQHLSFPLLREKIEMRESSKPQTQPSFGETFMSEKPVAKTIEERVADLEAKVKELENALQNKVDHERLNKAISDLRYSVKNHRL